MVIVTTDISSTNTTQDQMTDMMPTNPDDNDLLDDNSVSSMNSMRFFPTPPSKSRSVSIGVSPFSQLEEDLNQPQINTESYVYTGDIYAEKKHGKGILSWSDGRRFTGTFFADKRHGFGIDHTPNISEFKGLYCHDERFGPGILLHQSLERADVGLWLGDKLIRLLHPHPNLRIELEITTKKPRESSPTLIPSWYSPEELLSTLFGYKFLSKKKQSNLFCSHIRNDQTSINEYLHRHLDRIRQTMSDKYAQLDAYLSSLDENSSKDIVSHERPVEIPSPNETYEQQQVFNYINQFWPFKKRALFPIDDIISNIRSSFPNPGPIETASLNFFQSSFHGHEKEVRDLLNERLVYVDVCDCQGLTSLHFATYNAHRHIINLLLDFGANVNQLSDDSLTPLGLAFLLFYGDHLYQTMNIAFEHSDPVLINPRTPSIFEANSFIQSKANLFTSSSYFMTDTSLNDDTRLPSSFQSMKINNDDRNSYGFQLTDSLRERIRNHSFRQSIHSVILLLLRRGADPSLSDWPMPILALAVRSDDLEMVQLLIEKKVRVNCQLNPNRHASLTPLHIACGSTSPNALDIARCLLEHGANVNARTSPGNREYFSLIDPLILETNQYGNENEQHGRTPLHITCARDQSTETLDLARLLLEYQGDPNAVCNGQTPLTLAIIRGDQPLVDLLLNHESTDPATPLGMGNGNALCTVLSTFHESRWTYAQRVELIERLVAKNPRVFYPVRFGPKNTLGSSVDYAHFMFSADTRISQTPFHSLNNEERTKFSERKQLLTYVAKRFREEMTKYEEILRSPTSHSEIPTRTPSPTNVLSRSRTSIKDKSVEQWKINDEFRYCATCGRGVGVRLTACKRCQKVYFCSKTCKVDGWNQFHRYQCRLLANSVQLIKTVTRVKSAMNFDRILTLKTPPKPTNKIPLPPIPISKLLRQRRIKNRQHPPTHALDGSELSWNYTYNAPENYSFN